MHPYDKNIDILDYLACQKCGGGLRMEGQNNNLQCPACGNVMYFHDSVFLADEAPNTLSRLRTIQEFGNRWNKVFEKMGGLKKFLLPTIKPVQEKFFKGKVIVDAGGGFGRLTKLFVDYGAKHVFLLDASDAVWAANKYLTGPCRDKVTVVKGDVFHPPFRDDCLDIFFCHGVLHHTGDARQTILRMSRAVKRQTGAMILWVYAREGNGLLSRLVNLVRLVSLRSGDKGRWALAHAVDASLWLLAKAVYAPLIRCGLPKHCLWYGEYLLDFLFDAKANNLTDRLQMYHDFLTTDIIEYYSKKQLEDWVRQAGYNTSTYYFYRGQSWTVSASYDPMEDFSGAPCRRAPSPGWSRKGLHGQVPAHNLARKGIVDD